MRVAMVGMGAVAGGVGAQGGAGCHQFRGLCWRGRSQSRCGKCGGACRTHGLHEPATRTAEGAHTWEGCKKRGARVWLHRIGRVH